MRERERRSIAERDANEDASIREAIPRDSTVADLLGEASAHAKAGIFGAIATVVGRHGSTPSTPGQKLYLATDGTCLGTVGGGALELTVLEQLRARVMTRDESVSIRSHKLTTELGMCCGGQVELLYEPVLAQIPCLVVGAGHVARATVPALLALGFSVVVSDEREEWASSDAFPKEARVVCGTWDEAGKGIAREGVVLVMTHDHTMDQDAITWALRAGFAFVGGLGSRRKAHVLRERLRARELPDEDISRVRMPVGVDVGARLPAEIAVAIAAELVQWRRQNSASHADPKT